MKIFSIILLAVATTASAQSNLRPPMDGVLLPSANFAETRPNHLHSGVDIKTGGVEGKPVLAADRGYVSRINIAPRGFGLTVYINHGAQTTVYAHLQRFSPTIAAYVKKERYRLEQSNIDLYPPASALPVTRGELIGYSGNTGSSQGPHLHYEVRETGSQKPLNPIKIGAVRFTDNIAPTIVRLHYVEVDSVGVVPVASPRKSFEVVRGMGGEYALKDTAALQLAPNGYFVLEATDRKNGTANTMGIYRAGLSMDGTQLFGFQLDKFAFGQTKYVNSLCCYSMQLGVRNQMLRLAVQQGNRLPVYTHRGGGIALRDNARHSVRIEVEDDSDNRSWLQFAVRLREPSWQVERFTVEGETVDCTCDVTLQEGGVRVTIPAGVLYESIFLPVKESSGATIKPPHYSPVWAVGSAHVPLHKPITVAVRADDLPVSLRPKACLGLVTADGTGFTYAGGVWRDGWVEGRSSVFGRFVAGADNEAPVMTVSFSDGASMAGRASFTVTLRDNLSGIAAFEGEIDGKWIIFEQKGSVYTHFFDPERASYGNGAKHTLKLSARDPKGNASTLERSFER